LEKNPELFNSLSLTDKKQQSHTIASPTAENVFKLNNPSLILAEVQAHNIFTPPLQNTAHQAGQDDSFRQNFFSYQKQVDPKIHSNKTLSLSQKKDPAHVKENRCAQIRLKQAPDDLLNFFSEPSPLSQHQSPLNFQAISLKQHQKKRPNVKLAPLEDTRARDSATPYLEPSTRLTPACDFQQTQPVSRISQLEQPQETK